MKVRESASFTTSQKNNGVVPALPASSGVDKARLTGYLNEVANASDPFSGPPTPTGPARRSAASPNWSPSPTRSARPPPATSSSA